DVKKSPAIYRSTDSSVDPTLVYFIYFSDSTTDAKDEKEATYIRYTLNPPNRYINPTGKKTITLTPANIAPDTEDGAITDTCTLDGIGWIVCPVMQGLAEGMDFVFERIRGFLTVQPITTSVDNPIYRIWTYSRDLANIAFVIGFMVIIYSYLVGGGFNGYEIRKILPRLVFAAVLINISYLICAAAVDVSNIAGYGVNQLFENVRDEVLPGSSAGPTADVNWTSVTGVVLAGGVGVGAGVSLLPGVAGGGAVAGGVATGLWYLLAPFLFGAALLIMVTFFILAARQAIIIILIAIAPLAFAAFILPNTEKWFERWRSLFFTMLIMFPAFGAVFGGAQLAGEVIIRTATSIEQIILGLGVMVAPLAITPLLLKLGGGVLNRFGGVINNPRKGLYDRYKNYNQDRLGEQRASAQKVNANLLANGGFSRRQFVRKRAAQNYAKKSYRDEQKKQDEESAVNSWHNQTGRYGYSNPDTRGDVRSRITGRPINGYGNLDTYKRDNKLDHDATEAHHEKSWQSLVANDPARQAIQSHTRMDQRLAKITEDGMSNADDRKIATSINEDAAYAGYRATQVQGSVDKGVADIHTAAVESAGKLALSQTVTADRNLRKTKVETFVNEKKADTIDNTLKQNAEANWSNLSKNDVGVQKLRLKETQATDQAKRAEASFNKLIADAKANGSRAQSVDSTNRAIAGSIQTLGNQIVHEEKATAALNTISSSNAEALYVKSNEGKSLNVKSQISQDTLEYTKADETARIQEWRTKKGAKGLTGQDAVLAAALNAADYEKRVEAQRAGAAKRQSDIEYAVDVKDLDDVTGLPTDWAKRAGGIEGEAGITQARATAFQAIVEAQNKGVAAATMLLSRTENDDLLGAGPEGLAAPDILDRPSEQISAIGSTIAGRMHQKSHIRLWEQMGKLQRDAEKLVADATNPNELTDAKEKLGKVKDLQQQVMGDKKRTPFGAGDYDQGQLVVGEYDGNIYDSTRKRIMTHMSGKRLAEMDPDDMRLIFEMAREGQLDQGHMAKIAKAYQEWQTDDNLKSSLEDKHRFMLEPLKQYAQTNDLSVIPKPGDPAPDGAAPSYWKVQYDDLAVRMRTP
ncbi:hypothetical protein H7142_00015, partial [Candidatus Saccharibacteria bacterium]|nr:hypothetical protein [Candidatus Saccharibacteria bacterium]